MVTKEIWKDIKGYEGLYHPSKLQFELEVNHIDGNKNNNTLANLKWVTSSENIQKGIESKLVNRRPVEFYRKMASGGQRVRNILDGKEFSTMIEAARHYEVSVELVSKSCKENKCIKGLQFQKN